MRWRVVAFVSLGVNVLLIVGWLLFSRHSGPRPSASAAGTNAALNAAGRTNIVLRRQLFSWREIESSDYPTYIANLRNIGCPEQTIRDIIIADVNNLYARRRALEVVTADQQWWRSEPDSNVVQVAMAKLRALDDERRTLLTELLGPNWEAGDLASLPRPSRQAVALDGPVLGPLSTDTKQAVEAISLRSQERLQAYLDAQRQLGKDPVPAELARLRQQTRDDLALVLSPPQLEEFLLRYSQYANDLRADFGQLQFFNPTPDEFRAVFRATDDLDLRIQMLADATDPNSVQARAALEDQRENAIKVALGPARYNEYRLLHDPLYQDAVAQAEEAGTPEAVQTLYAINQAAAAQQNAVNSDTNLTASQKSIEQKRLELDQLTAQTEATDQPLPPEPPPAPPPKRTYTLRPGDTPSVVAMIYGVPESALRAANPNVDFNRLKPGDSINIPGSGLTPTHSPMVLPPLPSP